MCSFPLIQQTTFTNWFNDRLNPSKGMVSSSIVKVCDLAIDLNDGTLLIRLLENLTGKKIKGFVKTPKFNAHKLVNLDLAFQFMNSEDIKLIGIGKYYIISDLLCIMISINIMYNHFTFETTCIGVLIIYAKHEEPFIIYGMFEAVVDTLPAGGQNVFQGDLKLIMGLVWTLIQKYQLRLRSELSGLASVE